MKFEEIIFFYPSFEKGGVEKIITNLIKNFSKEGMKIHLISSNKILKKKGLIKFYKVKKFDYRVYTSFFSVYNLVKVLINNLKRKEKICLFSLQSNSIAIFFGKILGYRVVIRNSEYPLGSIISLDDNIIKTSLIFIQKLILYNWADLIISNSRGSRNSIRQFVIKKEKVINIYNPYIKKILKQNLNYKNNSILFVGRLTKQKGIIYLLKAFSLFLKEYQNFKLLFVGSGPEKKLINKYAYENKIVNKIKIIPWTSNLKKIYYSSKYFVLPSVYEGLGNVVIEALNYSRICIVSDCKHGPSEILNNGKGGFIFKSKNYRELYKKLITVENNNNLGKKKIEYGRKKLNRFLINNQCKKYLKAIQNL